MFLSDDKHLKIENPKLLSPLTLAFIGDAVYEVMVREYFIRQANQPVHKLHKKAVSMVRASAQSQALDLIYDRLSEDEIAIYKRGRNAQANVPKNADVGEYHRATGFEALFGYIYLCENKARMVELFDLIWEKQHR